MKYIWLILLFLSFSANLFAFTVYGTVKGLKDGETVYLMGGKPGVPEHKWGLDIKIDSSRVAGGQFTLQVPDSDYGQMWLLRTERSLIKYFFGKNENLTIEGRLNSLGLKDEQVTSGNDNLLMNDIFAMLEVVNPNPIEKRNAITWIKRHASDDIAVYALAYFYMQDKKLEYRDAKELISFFPEKQQQNPFYKTIEAYHREYGAIQPGEKMKNIVFKGNNGEQQTIPEMFRGKPLLICSCTQSDAAYWYNNCLTDMQPLLEQYPGLSLLLVYPTLKNPELRKQPENRTNERITLVNLPDNLSPASLNVSRSSGCILLDSASIIISLSDNPEELKKALDTPFHKEGYKIAGYVEGISNGIAELVTAKEGTLGTPAILDTVIIKNGYFTFQGTLPRPKFCNIGIRGTAFPVGFFLENSDIEVNIRISHSTSSRGKTICLNGQQYGSASEKNYREVMELEKDGIIGQWIIEHPADIPTLFHMATSWVNRKSPEVLDKWLKMFAPEMKQYIEYQTILQQIDKRRKLAPGQLAPDFTLPDISGKNIALKKFRGKYLLIDFWASWCGPCRMEIPNLKKVYEKYHAKGLDIASITIDRDEDAWKKAAREEEMPWFQLNANKTDVSKRYNVQGIPHILLLDKKGNIIAENLRGKALEEALRKIME